VNEFFKREAVASLRALDERTVVQTRGQSARAVFCAAYDTVPRKRDGESWQWHPT
jgi:hypothetical protein